MSKTETTMRTKFLAVFDKVIVDAAGVINAPQLVDEIFEIIKNAKTRRYRTASGRGE